jgi:hypothetical protein
MNREDELNKMFPLKDGTTYIQSLDKANEPKGAGVGGESKKEIFIDSMNEVYETKIICLVHNLKRSITNRGMIGRGIRLYWRNMDSTIRFSLKQR